MKRLLIGLVPWMAMTTAAGQDSLRPAEVVLSHHGPAEAWRLGDECLVSPSVLQKWGWSYTQVQSEATISAEGRVVRVNVQTVSQKVLVPLRPALEQLGAGFEWQKDKNVLEAWSVPRFVSVKGGKITFDGTLAVKPNVFFLDGPPRVVVDFKGARIGAATKLDLDSNARVGQFAPHTVRVVLASSERPVLSPSINLPTRSFQLLAGPLGEGQQLENPPTTGQTEQPPLTPVGDPVNAGPLLVAKEDDASATFSLRLSGKLQKPLSLKRLDPVTLELWLPNAKYIQGEFASPSIKEIKTEERRGFLVLTLVFARPMGLELSEAPGELRFLIMKPDVGDGKLSSKLIVVDPGHGGHDSGARSPDKKVNEKDLNLAISKLLSEELVKQGATVIMTRKTDTFIALQERAEIANRNSADLFLSVHINSNTVANSRSGGITFYHGNDKVSKLLADCIQSEIAKIKRVPSIGVWSDYRIYNNKGFAVLRHSKMPGVLIETGFINHSRDRKQMVTQEFQRQFAQAIVRGLKVYLGDVKPQE